MISSILKATPRLTPTLLTRALATDAAATSQQHRPLIQIHGLHARYANATYTAASKASLLPKVEEELLAIQDVAHKSPAFQAFLDNPLISRDKKEMKITDLLGDKVTHVTLNLMCTLAGNARLPLTSKIVDTYGKLMNAKRGEVEATITSADPLTKAQLDAVTQAMKTQVAKGKKVVLSTQVDPTILGGLQIQIGDKFLDLSVGKKIDEISRTAV